MVASTPVFIFCIERIVPCGKLWWEREREGDNKTSIIIIKKKKGDKMRYSSQSKHKASSWSSSSPNLRSKVQTILSLIFIYI